MSILNKIETRSQQEVIKELQEKGIQVIMKPVALVPDNIADYDRFARRSHGTIQMDIYEALKRLETRERVAIDPFS